MQEQAVDGKRILAYVIFVCVLLIGVLWMTAARHNMPGLDKDTKHIITTASDDDSDDFDESDADTSMVG